MRKNVCFSSLATARRCVLHTRSARRGVVRGQCHVLSWLSGGRGGVLGPTWIPLRERLDAPERAMLRINTHSCDPKQLALPVEGRTKLSMCGSQPHNAFHVGFTRVASISGITCGFLMFSHGPSGSPYWAGDAAKAKPRLGLALDPNVSIAFSGLWSCTGSAAISRLLVCGMIACRLV